MSVSKNKIKKTGHRVCLRDIMGQTYPIKPAQALTTRVISSVHGTFCGSWKLGFLKWQLDK